MSLKIDSMINDNDLEDLQYLQIIKSLLELHSVSFTIGTKTKKRKINSSLRISFNKPVKQSKYN